MGPRTLVFPGNDAADMLARQGALLASLVSIILFFRTGGVLSHRNFWHAGSLSFHRGTCAPSLCLPCSFSSTLQRTQPSVKFLSL